MPTVVLLDVSASLLRCVDGLQRKDVLQRGILHFLTVLQEAHPNERVALLTFSSVATVVVPFTTDFKSLRTALYGIQLQDLTDVHAGLAAASDLISSCANCGPCQIVLVTDGRPVGDNPCIVRFPVPIRLNVVACGEPRECNLQLYRHLTALHCGTCQFVASGSVVDIKNAFTQLAQLHFPKWSGHIACGHLSSSIALQPDPFLTVHIAAGSNVLPSVLSIVGFIPLKNVSSIPTLSRHVILSSPDELSGFYGLLYASLRSENAAAVITLSGNSALRYALVVAATLPSPVSNAPRDALLLDVPVPGLELPWLGNLADIILAPTPPPEIPTAVWPVPSYALSRKQYNFSCLEHDLIQSNLGKVVRCLRQAPVRADVLETECNKIKLCATTYRLPGLMELLLRILETDIGEQTDVRLKNILHGVRTCAGELADYA